MAFFSWVVHWLCHTLGKGIESNISKKWFSKIATKKMLPVYAKLHRLSRFQCCHQSCNRQSWSSCQSKGQATRETLCSGHTSPHPSCPKSQHSGGKAWSKISWHRHLSWTLWGANLSPQLLKNSKASGCLTMLDWSNLWTKKQMIWMNPSNCQGKLLHIASQIDNANCWEKHLQPLGPLLGAQLLVRGAKSAWHPHLVLTGVWCQVFL